MRVQGESARILITVKTTPMPSASYGDTVCVAGVRLDKGAPHWVRLYPINFRWLDAASQFKKYDVIEVEIRRRDKDSRRESYSPDLESIRRVAHLKDWPARQTALQDLPRTTTCALRAGTSDGKHDGPSLGMVGVESLVGHSFERHPGWTPQERERIANAMNVNTGGLFGDSATIPPVLRAPLLKLSYRYRCMESKCPGHDGQLLDWELTELERHTKGGIEAKKKAIEYRFVEMMFRSGVETSFYMGNFEAAIKRNIFSVLGVHYPPSGVASLGTLF